MRGPISRCDLGRLPRGRRVEVTPEELEGEVDCGCIGAWRQLCLKRDGAQASISGARGWTMSMVAVDA